MPRGVGSGRVSLYELKELLGHSTLTMVKRYAHLAPEHLRALLSAYAGLWTFPGPARVPTDLEDLDARLELRRRLSHAQLDLFADVGAA